VTLFDCGHFVPEERPDEVVQAVLKMVAQTNR
jgi:pimeloyl-ACP methyl ester carboxylesterase